MLERVYDGLCGALTKKESARLRGKGDQIMSFDFRFETRQGVGLKRERRKQGLP